MVTINGRPNATPERFSREVNSLAQMPVKVIRRALFSNGGPVLESSDPKLANFMRSYESLLIALNERYFACGGKKGVRPYFNFHAATENLTTTLKSFLQEVNHLKDNGSIDLNTVKNFRLVLAFVKDKLEALGKYSCARPRLLNSDNKSINFIAEESLGTLFIRPNQESEGNSSYSMAITPQSNLNGKIPANALELRQFFNNCERQFKDLLKGFKSSLDSLAGELEHKHKKILEKNLVPGSSKKSSAVLENQLPRLKERSKVLKDSTNNFNRLRGYLQRFVSSVKKMLSLGVEDPGILVNQAANLLMGTIKGNKPELKVALHETLGLLGSMGQKALAERVITVLPEGSRQGLLEFRRQLNETLASAAA